MANPMTYGAGIDGYYEVSEVLGRLNAKHNIGLTEGQVEYLARHFAADKEPNPLEALQYGFKAWQMPVLGNLQEWAALASYGDSRQQFPQESGMSRLLGKTPLELRQEAWGDWEGPGGEPVDKSWLSPAMGRMSAQNTEERGRQRDTVLLQDLLMDKQRDEDFHKNWTWKSGWGDESRSMLMGGRPPEGAFPDSRSTALDVYRRGVDENGELKPHMYDSLFAKPNYGGAGWEEFQSHANSPGTVIGTIAGFSDPLGDSIANAASSGVESASPVEGGGNSYLTGALSFGKAVGKGVAGSAADAIPYLQGNSYGGHWDNAVELTRGRQNAYNINPQPPGVHRNERLENMERMRAAAAAAEGKPAYDHYSQETGGGQLSEPAQLGATMATYLPDPQTLLFGGGTVLKALKSVAKAGGLGRLGAAAKAFGGYAAKEGVEESPLAGALLAGQQIKPVPDTMENRQKILDDASARDQARQAARRDLPRLNQAFDKK